MKIIQEKQLSLLTSVENNIRGNAAITFRRTEVNLKKKSMRVNRTHSSSGFTAPNLLKLVTALPPLGWSQRQFYTVPHLSKSPHTPHLSWSTPQGSLPIQTLDSLRSSWLPREGEAPRLGSLISPQPWIFQAGWEIHNSPPTHSQGFSCSSSQSFCPRRVL